MVTVKDKRLIILSFVLMCFGIAYWIRSQRPLLEYKLEMYENTDEIDEIVEKPLELTSYDGHTINFEIIFGGAYNEYSKAILKTKLAFLPDYPFVGYNRDLVIIVSNPKYKLTEETALFRIDGMVSNLTEGPYKLRIEDSNKNLVDERTFFIGNYGLEENTEDIENNIPAITGPDGTIVTPTTPYDIGNGVEKDIDISDIIIDDKDRTDPTKFCKLDTDCVTVACGCACSGCGGVYYEDVINKKYEEVWYYQNSCQPAEICPQVCCPPNEIKCIENVCKVVDVPVIEAVVE